MTTQIEKGIKLEFRNDTVKILVNITIKRRNALIALILCICVLIILASSLNEHARRILVDVLLWILQILMFGEER